MKISKKKEGGTNANEPTIAPVWYDYEATTHSPSPLQQTHQNLPVIRY